MDLAYGCDLRRCVEQIRSMSGQYDFDIVWNRELKRWVGVQRVSEPKLKVDALIVGCLPNPNNPPPMTDMRGLFPIQAEQTGGYLNPIGREQEIAAWLVQRVFRNKEAWERIKRSKEMVAEDKAKADAEWRDEMAAATYHELARADGLGRHSVNFR